MGSSLVSLSKMSKNKMQNGNINDAGHTRYKISFCFNYLIFALMCCYY